MSSKDKGPPTFRVQIQAPKLKAVERKTNAGKFRGSPRLRGYGRKWDKESLQYRTDNPFCRFCEMLGRDGFTAVTDHIVPPRLPNGEIDHHLMWSRKNWEPLCRHHHDVTKQKLENEARKLGDMEILRIWCSDPKTWPSSVKPF